MSFRLVVNRFAQRDADEIVEYLAAQAPEQADRFIGDLESALVGIAENPLLTAEVRPAARTRNLAIFPFGVWYRIFIDRELVEVFAVLHHRRGPDALNQRMPR